MSGEDAADVPSRHAGRLEAAQAFLDVEGLVPLAYEVTLRAEIDGKPYAGRADLLAACRADVGRDWREMRVVVADWKSGRLSPAADEQVAAYIFAVFASLPWRPLVIGYAVHLPDGADWGRSFRTDRRRYVHRIDRDPAPLVRFAEALLRRDAGEPGEQRKAA